jgi:predicted GNAT family acetyltransferase
MQRRVDEMSSSVGANVSDPIQDNTERSRFELDVDGQVVFASYRRQGEVLAIYHVEPRLSCEAQVRPSKLMRGVAERARQEGLRITPYCGYARPGCGSTREYRDLLG